MDTRGIAFCYDKKIISETSVALTIHTEMITLKLTGSNTLYYTGSWRPRKWRLAALLWEK